MFLDLGLMKYNKILKIEIKTLIKYKKLILIKLIF